MLKLKLVFACLLIWSDSSPALSSNVSSAVTPSAAITGPNTIHVYENVHPGSCLHSLASVSVDSVTHMIGTVLAKFSISGSPGSTVWSLTGNYSSNFTINEAGVLSVFRSPDREVNKCLGVLNSRIYAHPFRLKQYTPSMLQPHSHQIIIW